MELLLRKATKNDIDLTFKIERYSLKEYSDAIYTTKIDAHRKAFDATNIQIIEFEKQEIGYVEIEEKNHAFEIINLLIVNNFQNQGLGSYLLRQIIQHGQKKSKGIELQVFKNNLKAKRFYENIGFQVYYETEFEFKMKFSKIP